MPCQKDHLDQSILVILRFLLSIGREFESPDKLLYPYLLSHLSNVENPSLIILFCSTLVIFKYELQSKLYWDGNGAFILYEMIGTVLTFQPIFLIELLYWNGVGAFMFMPIDCNSSVCQ